MKAFKNIAAALLCLASLAPASAWPHASLVKAIPAPRAVLYAAPARVQLWFSEPLEPRFCSVAVSDAAGRSADAADLQVPARDLKQLSIGLAPLAAGTYTVKYRVLSVDGHVIEGRFTFTVRDRR